MAKEFDYEFVFKIIAVGDPAVGKTSLIQRFTQGSFNTNYIATIGAQFSRFEEVRENCYVRLFFWDVAGQREFSFMRPTFYTGSKAAILVFDLTEPKSFESLSEWLAEIKKYCGDIPTIVFANKNDLEHSFDQDKLQKFVADNGCLGHILTSAKTGENVEAAFQKIITELLEIWKAKK
ncbi:MAG: Rab family GTPase [Promethearchaeota archaeon]